MLTRHERKERLGFGHLARVAARAEQNTGKRYSISRISQVINCEKTGERNPDIENAVVQEINERRPSPLDPIASAADVFPPIGSKFPLTSAAPNVATTPSP